jgi:hypothetical protein
MPHHHGKSGKSMRVSQKPTYHHANEFSGVTSKPANTKKFTKAKNEQFFKSAEIPNIPTPIGSLLHGAFEKGAEVNRRFFADPNAKAPILNKKRKSVLEAGKYKPLRIKTSIDDKSKATALTQSDFEAMSLAQKEESYKGYLKLRSEGKIDAYGNVHPNYRREFIRHKDKEGNITYRETYMKSGAGDDGGSSRANVVTTKSVGGKSILTTEGEVAENKAATEKQTETKLTKRRIKARGRKTNIYTGSSGEAKDKLILGKKSLLGMV